MFVRHCVLLWIFCCASAICHAEDLARISISGQVVDSNSRPVSGAKVLGYTFADETKATTDQQGRFTLEVVEQQIKSLAILAEDAVENRLGVFKADWQDPPNSKTPIEISLAASRQLPVKVLDAQGEPAVEVRVGAVISNAPLVHVVTDAAGKAVLSVPQDCELNALYASKPEIGFDYRVVFTHRDPSYQAKWLEKSPIRFQLAEAQTVRVRLLDPEEKPITRTEISLWLLRKPSEPSDFNLSFTPTEFRIKTDENGVAEFRGVPNWETPGLTFWPRKEQYVHSRIRFNPKDHANLEVTKKLARVVPMSGQVRFSDGRPAADITVSIIGAGYQFDGFRKTVKTDPQGNFEVRVTPNSLYVLGILDEQYAAPLLDGIVVRPDELIEGLQIELGPATRIHGQVTVGADMKPVEGQRITLNQNGRSLNDLEGIELPNPEDSNVWISPSIWRYTMTDNEGRYEFFVGAGRFRLTGPSQREAEVFEITTEEELEFDFASARPEKGPFAGRVVTGDPPVPVADAVIEGKYRADVNVIDLRLRTDDEGHFSGERMLHTTVLYVVDQDGKLAGIKEIGPDEAEVTLQIGPLASATARLIDSKTGKSLPNEDVRWGRDVHFGDDTAPFQTSWGGTVKTDSVGNFKIEGLVVGQEYSMSVVQDGGQRCRSVGKVTPETVETIELGDLELKPPYKPPTLEERMEKNLVAEAAPLERYEQALEQAELLHQHVLVVFLERDTELTKSWFKLRLDDSEIRTSLANYQLIHIAADADGAAGLAEKLGMELDTELLPIWRFSDAAGKQLEAGTVMQLNDVIDKYDLLTSLETHAPEPLDAREILQEALAEAKESDRLVIVQETATWCGPCHKLSKYLDSHQQILEKDYLWIKIDQRWSNSKEVMEEIYPDKRGGIPWFAIIDGNKGLMVTSNGPNGNIGFPAKKDEIEFFLAMFQSTMLRMTTEDLDVLRMGIEAK